MSRSDISFIFTIIALMFLFLGEPDVFDSLQNSVITSVIDNGCSSHQELKPTKTRIENYNLTNL